ncbi:uncharacterized protein LOC142845702 isoform X2 [Microtus pennsylvanicus]|uniref:uncharacterized protein LOC142845702 isoform X2 n=1 Tax=Microtus pennsylvanicus TaxID=10058 RepID=UPI003F6D03A8
MAAGGAGGRGCNPLGAGPWLCTSGSIPGAWCRTRISSRSGRVRTLLSWAWWGGTLHLRTDAGCSAGSASAAAARPERCPLAPGSLPETRGPEALTGLRRPSASRGVHGASGPASPAAAPPRKWTPAAGPERSVPPRAGRRAARPRADAQASGRLRVAELQPLVPPLQSRLGQDCGVTEQALGTGRRPRGPRSCAV